MDRLILAGDAVVALAILVGLAWAAATGRIGPAGLRRWAIGFALGMGWELPLLWSGEATHEILRAWDGPAWTRTVAHSVWDAALFETGTLLARAGTGGWAFLRRFSPRAQALYSGFGLASSLVVEAVGTGRLWRYHVLPWNPVLFRLDGEPLTLLPQAIWIAAPLLYYAAIRRWAAPAPQARVSRAR